MDMTVFYFIGSGQILADCSHDALSRMEAFVDSRQTFVFEEEDIFVFVFIIYDISVYGCRAEIKKQFGFCYIRKIIVDIRIEQFEVRLETVTHRIFPVVPSNRIVNHIFLSLLVPNDLRCPYGVQVLAVESGQVGESFRKVYRRMLPMYQVVAFHENKSVVTLPTLI